MLRSANSLAVDGSSFSRDSNLLNLHGNVLKARKSCRCCWKVLSPPRRMCWRQVPSEPPTKTLWNWGRMAVWMGKGWFLHVLQALLWGCIVYYIYIYSISYFFRYATIYTSTSAKSLDVWERCHPKNRIYGVNQHLHPWVNGGGRGQRIVEMSAPHRPNLDRIRCCAFRGTVFRIHFRIPLFQGSCCMHCSTVASL